MENKETEKIVSKNSILFFLSSFLILVYFFYGYYVDENSAGAGGYGGDFQSIWNNLKILEESIILNINNSSYNDSRPPLSYILHILFNPFINDQELFRHSVLLISLIVPFFLFFSIKENYPKLDYRIIFFLATIITLSPYFRTTAYWALGENYGLIFLILSYLVFQKFTKKIAERENIKNYLYILLICFFSSIIVYFDQKLIFIPFTLFVLILFLKVDFKYKLTSFFLFLLFSFPYIYLISLWGSIIPTSAALSRKVGLSLDFYNPVYCVTIIAFYIFPFLMCNSFKSFTFLKEKLNKNFFLIIGIFAIYFLIIGHFYEFNNIGTDGKGAFFKLSLILIKDSSYRFIITFFTFILSIIIILMFFDKKKDLFFILYFLILSLLTIPFYQ